MDAVEPADNNDTERLSFSQRRSMKAKQKKRKSKKLLSKLVENNSELERAELIENHNEEEKMETDITKKDDVNEEEKMETDIIKENDEREKSKEVTMNEKMKFEPVSNPNELEIDPSDIMSELELIKRKIDKMFEDDNINQDIFQFSESYLETKSSKYIRLLSEKNLFDQHEDADSHSFDIYNPNLIMDKTVIYILQNEMMSIFTLIVGIVEGVMLLSLFVVINNSNTEFLKKFASLLYIIQFLSYIVGVLLIPYSFILLNYTKYDNNNNNNNKVINKYQIGLFILCSVSILICCMIEFPISDEIYYLYDQNNDYFSEQSNVNNMSSQVSKWKKLHFAKFCFLSIIWILCISFFHETKPNDNDKKDE